ncbi:MAG: hypothetical protein ACRBBP_01015 [Bdellovibrionales bacterium]
MTSLELFFQDGNPNSWALLVDTSSVDGALIAISPSGEILKKLSWDKSVRHSNSLLSNFLDLSSDLGKNNIKHIFFIQGPGSFTGLRVGAAFVKTLSFSLGKIPITSSSSFSSAAVTTLASNTALKEFNILIPSIGNKSFSAKFKLEGSIWQETISLNGADESALELKNKFSIFDYVDSSVQKINRNIGDLVSPFFSKTNIHAHLKTHTYLDLYPLYLRQSEAEEKNRYDKVKL